MTPRARSRGTVLPIVLLLTSMMLVTAGAWLESSIVATRAAGSLRDRVQAFHAADGALARCSRLVVDAPGQPQAALVGEPGRWRMKASFEGAGAPAIMPFAAWPHAIRAPQCLIEAWFRSADAADAAARSYLLTARGFGSTSDSEAWLQLQIEVAESGTTRRWRRVVAKPF
jgi:Tfp pilus assembly protein PilX